MATGDCGKAVQANYAALVEKGWVIMVLIWKEIASEDISTHGTYKTGVWRAKVPGGWFVKLASASTGAFFYPDPEHTWDGSSLP